MYNVQCSLGYKNWMRSYLSSIIFQRSPRAQWCIQNHSQTAVPTFLCSRRTPLSARRNTRIAVASLGISRPSIPLFRSLKQHIIFVRRFLAITGYSYNKTKEMHYFSNLFWYGTLHVSDRFTVHHQESSTVYTVNRYLSYRLCWQSASSILIPLADSQHNLYDKYLLPCIQY